MNRIRLLPEHIANQIAAGEVVERPASVVKELVENSLDADARQITVVVQHGGRSLIRVTDDGWGMSPDDALLALERHATSKIHRAEDLYRISSLGFRGEALPSIASVSRFVMVTRERGALSGTRVEVAGGKILSVREEGGAEGTTIEVRNLFFNLPARRKFLRSDTTELAHIEHIVTLCALAHPRVAFRLVGNDRELFHLAPVTELQPRLRELYGAELVQRLVPVSWQENGIEVTGWIGQAGVSRADRLQQLFFVNARPIESRALQHAVREGYHTALMRGQYPVTFLFVRLDPASVDVNVHPTKREVRFRDEATVRRMVTEAVRRALAPPEPRGQLRPLPASVTIASQSTGSSAPPVAATTTAGPPLPASAELLPPLSAEVPGEQNARWKILGVIGRLYVVAESPEGLVLLDQHAAHERVLFERMLKTLDQPAAPSQRLLLPVTLELEARDADFLRHNLATLLKLGFGVHEFGPRAFLVDAIPPFLPDTDLAELMRRILDELRQTGEQVHSRRLSEDQIATTVCRHAVKAHDPLHGPELVSLLEQLQQCELPYTCPHGRPTMIQISYAELERKFRRVV
ncbi:MAG: DNA mismatch repair endonuclease MutL [Verrucomicrobiae bacterium]|nr:DNA mismatch repair endonuclease MutL [Verrucomicrobiae bacterium]